MKKIINSIVCGLCVMGALVVSVPVKAQSFQVEQPNAIFQSTSTMGGSGSAYSSNPTLDENGTANSPAASAPSGPRKAKAGTTPPPPVIDENDSGNTPVGDAVLPLLLMAMAFGGVIYLRRRKQAVVE